MSIRCLLVTLFLYAVNVLPQTNTYLTGSLSADSRLVLNEFRDNVVRQNPFEFPADKKSVVLAGVLSGIVPGAGEVYVGGTTNYIKAGAFVLIEAVAAYYAISYNKRGNDQTNFFQNFADGNVYPNHGWSVERYAKWINAQTPTKDMVKFPPNQANNPNPWERVDWASLNAAEDVLGASGTAEGTGFTHHLPPHGDQQYYELIGKYPQYARGWDDYNPPSVSYDKSYTDYITPEFHWYSEMRGDANQLYKVSARGVAFLYVNHLLSIVDAIWSSISFNKNLAVNVSYDRVNLGFVEDYTPTLHVKYNF
jgi:hypothetical protein